MFFVGYTRFSLFQPQSTAWHASKGNEDMEAYKAYLYSDERMQPRAEVFFGRSLMQLDRAARGHEVRHMISYSPEMPEKWRDMVLDAGERYPWLLLDEYKDGVGSYNMNRVARDLMRSHDVPTGVYGSYRLDDDDLLPLDYFDRVAAHMSDTTVGMYVSLGKGVTAMYQDGRFSNFRQVVHPKIAIGLLGVCRLEQDGTWAAPPGYASHARADEFAPVIIDSRQPGFFWTRSAQQDTVYRGGADALTAELERYTPATADEVLRWFPAAL